MEGIVVIFELSTPSNCIPWLAKPPAVQTIRTMSLIIVRVSFFLKPPRVLLTTSLPSKKNIQWPTDSHPTTHQRAN